MQTFLPYPDFELCASSLDYRRLGKQRVECKQILNALDNGGGWSNHPAVKMWRGYEMALRQYGNIIIREWIARGYNNNMPFWSVEPFEFPPWFGDDRVHLSHRRNLMRKDPHYYGKYWPGLEPQEGYFWPVN